MVLIPNLRLPRHKRNTEERAVLSDSPTVYSQWTNHFKAHRSLSQLWRKLQGYRDAGFRSLVSWVVFKTTNPLKKNNKQINKNQQTHTKSLSGTSSDPSFSKHSFITFPYEQEGVDLEASYETLWLFGWTWRTLFRFKEGKIKTNAPFHFHF